MGVATVAGVMTTEGTERTADWTEIDRWDGGTGWLAYPEEAMERASHALDGGGDDVWLVDPVDFDGLDDALADRGTVRGTVVLLDRHTRDADAVARRHDVPVHVPAWMDGVESDLDAPVRRLEGRLPDSEYRVRKLIDNRLWQEAFLYGGDSETLLVPEALGTASFFRTGEERLGVHAALRLKPPRTLRRLTVERILVGHGRGVFSDAQAALADALDGARRRAPGLYAKTVRDFLL